MRTKKGFVLYLTLILLSLLLLMSLALNQIIVSQSKVLQTLGKSVIAYYGAETGIERGFYEYYVNNRGPGFSASSILEIIGSNPVEYSVTFYSPSPWSNLCPATYYKSICIISTGKFLDNQRAVSSNY